VLFARFLAASAGMQSYCLFFMLPVGKILTYSWVRYQLHP
jgi:hypothetical protein